MNGTAECEFIYASVPDAGSGELATFRAVGLTAFHAREGNVLEEFTLGH